MANNISLGQYIPGQSVVHRLDPRVKIICVFLYMIGIFFVESFMLYIPFFILLMATIAIAGISFKIILKSVRPLIFVIIFTAILNILITPGEVLFQIWKFSVSKEGLIRAAFMSIRIVLLVLGTSILTLTTSAIALTDGLEGVMKPLTIIKFPAHELSMMISIALRFVPTLFEEADKIRKAQMARGADFESGNVFKKAKSMIPLLVPLFLNSFKRADDLSVAMVSRCYRGAEGRTKLNPLRLEAKDIFILIGMNIFIGIIIALKYIL